MPRLLYSFAGDAFGDGAGDTRFLIDLSRTLSELYGRLIRQGAVFRVKSIQASIYNPNTAAQDEVMAVSGKYLWYHPTSPRKKAWKSAFKATQVARKGQGAVMTAPNYDFRVGFSDGYAGDTGVPLQDGVAWNAWLNADDEPLLLSSGNLGQGVFQVYNDYALVSDDTAPHRPGAVFSHGFGSPFQKDADAIADPLDYTTGDSDGYFTPGQASLQASSALFQCSFTSLYESAIGATEAANSVTTTDTVEGPLDVMCGLIGIHVDMTMVDDDTPQSQDYGLRIAVDVESWSPIVKRKRKNGKSKRKR